MSMQPLCIDICVSPILKEWLVAFYGSETIECKQDDFLSSKIKYLLEVAPLDYKPKKVNPENRITIQLIYFAIGNPSAPDYKKISEYRFFLSSFSESIIERELNRKFKESFHNFVAGYVASTNLSVGAQKEGIEIFCKFYQLNMNDINYEMLKKSWDRSELKAKICAICN